MKHANHVKDLIRAPYAWPGGYPKYAIADDSAALCHTCCRDNFRSIVDSIHTDTRDGWLITAVDINWEDTSLYCDHCGDAIESAYGEPEEPVDYSCDQCQALMINGVYCHETGCPNQ